MVSNAPVSSNYDLIIFDLDGTLIDSRLDLANSVNYTRSYLGLPVLENELIYSYVGDGASMLIRRALGREPSDTEIKQALEIFLHYYKQHLLDHTVLYPGVREALDRLDSLTLTVLTNKPVDPSNAILKGLGVQEKFAAVYGGNSFEQKKPDPVGIHRILQDTGVSRDRALMVGDSRIDIQTGRNAGIATCGVTYGLASDTLQQAQPDFLIGNMRELLRIVYPSDAPSHVEPLI
ncbi:MAG: phosphoglycolate phosphatase [Acidobacteria bacterium]|nr:MAG: phosphoglycolate phosphatase [Acidobacteriota bacterium]